MTKKEKMSLLSGHRRIMEAAEAALVTMVLEEEERLIWAIIGVASRVEVVLSGWR